MKPSVRSFVLAAVAALGLAACGPAGKSDFDAARARWKAKGPARYAYTLKWSCFCVSDYTRPTRITVADGQISSAVDAETGAAVAQASRDVRTVDGLFDFLDDAFKRNAASIQATYDPQDGHPTQANIDYVANAADEEQSFTATDLTPSP